jgi:hypothetical protein
MNGCDAMIIHGELGRPSPSAQAGRDSVRRDENASILNKAIHANITVLRDFLEHAVK